MMRLSLSARLSLLVGGVLCIALLAFGWFWNAQVRTEQEIAESTSELLTERARDHLAQRAEQTIDYLRQALINPLIYVDLLAISELIAPFLRQPDVARLEVYDADLRLLHDGSSDLASFGNALDDATLPAAGVQLDWDPQALHATGAILFGDRPIGAVRMQYRLTPIEQAAAQAREDVDARLTILHERQGKALLILGSVVLALAVLSAWLVARSLMHPIRQLAQFAHQLEAGVYPSIPANTRRDELGDLVRRFAAMAEALRVHEQSIRREAQEDALTGLANRRHLRRHLDKGIPTLLERGGSAVVLFLDLDQFKPINDAHGHAAGDQLLREVANALSHISQGLSLGEDDLLARLGGDEFLLWLVGADAEQKADRFVEQLIPALRALGARWQPPIQLSASIGLARFPEHGRTPAELLKAADLAMYRAKRAGGGRVARYDPSSVSGDPAGALRMDGWEEQG
jgi:diguanylate cyclase (GGDEF)-like protein